MSKKSHAINEGIQKAFYRIDEKKLEKKVNAEFSRLKSIGRYNSITYPRKNGLFLIEPSHNSKGAYQPKYLAISPKIFIIFP